MGNIHSYVPHDLELAIPDLHAMSDAFDLAMLELREGNAALEEAIARAIIAAAVAGDRDPVSLCDKALAHVGLLPEVTGVADRSAPRAAAPKKREVQRRVKRRGEVTAKVELPAAAPDAPPAVRVDRLH